MGDSVGGGFSMDPDGLHGTGRTISSRSVEGGSAAKGLKDGLHGASHTVGHKSVGRALQDFLLTNVNQPADHLPDEIDGGGRHVSNTASTGRNDDNDRGSELKGKVATTTELGLKVNRQGK